MRKFSVIGVALLLIALTGNTTAVEPRCPSVAPEIEGLNYYGGSDQVEILVQSDAEATYNVIFYDENREVTEMKQLEKTSGFREESYENMGTAPAKVSVIPEDCSFTGTSTEDIEYSGVSEKPQIRNTETLVNQISQKNDTISNLRSEVKSKEETIEELRSNLSSNQESEQEQNGSLVSDYEEKISELERKLEDRNETISELQSTIENLNSTKESSNQERPEVNESDSDKPENQTASVQEEERNQDDRQRSSETSNNEEVGQSNETQERNENEENQEESGGIISNLFNSLF